MFTPSLPRSTCMSPGRFLSRPCYEEQLAKIHAGLPRTPNRQHCIDTRAAQLDLLIDHRLGLDFPAPRRAQLLHAQKVVDSCLPLVVLSAVARTPLPPSHGLGKKITQLCAQVLSQEELKVLFDLTQRDPDNTA